MSLLHVDATPAPARAEVASARRPDPREQTLTRLVVAALLVLAGAQIEIRHGLTVAAVALVVLAPVWLRPLRDTRGGPVMAGLVLLSLVSGLWLTAYASADHGTIPRLSLMWSALLLSLLTSLGVVLWARTLLHPGTIAVLYGTGLLVSNASAITGASNPWKFGLSLPLTVLLLGLAARRGSRVMELAALLLLAGLSATNDSRSHFAMVLLAALLAVWQSLFRGGRRPGRAWRAVVVLAALGVTVYSLGQALLLDGYLGEETQVRSQQQLERSGSVVLGGRPEIGATLALAAHRPIGLGSGTRATSEEIAVAKGGMAQLGYDPNNGYVEGYMFGEVVELHSGLGDLWVLFGIPGAVLGLAIARAMVRRTAAGLATRSLSALEAFLAARILWDLLFGPFYSTLPLVALGVGLALHRSARPVDAPS